MKPIYVAIPVSLLAGVALGALMLDEAPETDPAPAVAANPADYFDAAAPVDERIEALERIVAEERNARMVLEDQIAMLMEEIDRIDAEGPEVLSGSVQMLEQLQSATSRSTSIQATRRGLRADRDSRVAELVNGGFDPDRAGWIVDRLTEMQFEAMQARYEAQRNGEALTRSLLANNPEALLRSEIGDTEFERYLEALGRPTVVGVDQVMAASPANRAGLQVGDRIVSYNGQRVFNMVDLRRATFASESGVDVVVDIDRNGTPIQVVMPAGPLGIIGSGGRRGN